ncbi:hypothetical protein CEXT_704991 [Caerostris extrusa]|uniref:Uncharacterized protein n=1 Tax=Caerostris extrusa TaxID=172846 RepID=A0AAV4MDY9_CAEEX|nr:hypothetical protein CEXT_704991 [Caerostris extrusa]
MTCRAVLFDFYTLKSEYYKGCDYFNQYPDGTRTCSQTAFPDSISPSQINNSLIMRLQFYRFIEAGRLMKISTVKIEGNNCKSKLVEKKDFTN